MDWRVKALSRIVTVLFMIAFLLLGALLSYMCVAGYYISLGVKTPETNSITITNVKFQPQNTSYFNITVMNPSFSPSNVSISKISVIIEGKEISDFEVNPEIPKILEVGSEETFKCLWNWANYTGMSASIIVFIDEGSGAAVTVSLPSVSLGISEIKFNATETSYFNITIENAETSETYVNLTRIEVIIRSKRMPIVIEPTLPMALNPGETITVKCLWNWTEYRNETITVIVHTLQGYTAWGIAKTPPEVELKLGPWEFKREENKCFLNITISNSLESPSYATISSILIIADNETMEVEVLSPKLPYKLEVGASVVVQCRWNCTKPISTMNVIVESIEGHRGILIITLPPT